MSAHRFPTYYISHGGGPAFWIDYPPPIGRHGFDHLKSFLQGLPQHFGARPRAFLVISAHWETEAPTVSTSPAPGMLYDYYGFPPVAYTLQHPAPGDPALASRIADLLRDAGLPCATDSDRGFDHGVFVPMMMIDPDARTPTVMLSIRQDLDPTFHIQLGRALTPLRDEGVVIIGSGSSFHNLRTYFKDDPANSIEFDTWLAETALDPETRNERLMDWEQAPAARACHPREEHLIPMLVAAAAATGESGQIVYKDTIAQKAFSAFAFG